MRSGLKRKITLWAACFLAWTALGLFMFSQGMVQKLVTKDPFPWWHHLTGWMVGVWLWFVLTPVVLWLGRRFPFERGRWGRRIALHVAIAAFVSIFQLAVESAVLRGIGVFPQIMATYVSTLAFLVILSFHQGILTYLGILGMQYAHGWYVRYQERKQEALRLELRSAELQKQLVQAHLNALKMQLQPHFLFNTLNAIMVLVRQQKGREAEEMLARLSDLLRWVLDEVEAQEVPLRRELEYLQLYLSIEQVRFQDRLRVEITADPEVLEAAVPHMILQPIVENAIRHGIGRSSSAGRIKISAFRVGEALEMRIEDDGPGLSTASSSSAARAGTGQERGIGLANTRARLERLYGESARLTVENGEHGGVAATIVLPCHAMHTGSERESLEAHAFDSVAG